MILHNLKGITDVIIFESMKDWISNEENIKFFSYQLYTNKNNKIDLYFSLKNNNKKYNLNLVDVRDYYGLLNNFLIYNILDKPIFFLENYGNYSFYEKQKRKRIQFFGEVPLTVGLTEEKVYLSFFSGDLFLIDLGKLPFEFNDFIENMDTKRPFNIHWNKEGFKVVFRNKQKKFYSSLQVNF